MERYSEELEQISIKNKIGQRSKQNTSRADVIKMNIDKDKEDFKTCGIGR